MPRHDKWFDRFAADWGRKLGVKVTVDHIEVTTIPARFSSEIAAKSGHCARSAGNMPWAGPLSIAIFFVYLVPPTLLFIALTRVVNILGLQDSTWSLVLIYPTITIRVSVWLLTGFLKAIPRDVEEQAMVDGHSRVGAFARIVVPLTLPGIVAVIVFAFTLTAHEFIYALAFISPSANKTVSVGVPTQLVRGDVFFWQSLQAAAILVAVPIAFAFNLMLERFITGFTMGAVKG